MPFCIVKECPNSRHKSKIQAPVTYHVFPTSEDMIKKWLHASRQYHHNLEDMVSTVIQTNKTRRYRMCSLHFNNEQYCVLGLTLRLQKDAVPQVFGVDLQRKILSLDSEPITIPRLDKTKKICVSLKKGLPVERVYFYAKETQTANHICHACGHTLQTSFRNASTNTSIEYSNQKTQCENATLLRSMSTQTSSCGKNISTSTKDLIPKRDAYCWTMGQIQDLEDKGVQTETEMVLLLESTSVEDNDVQEMDSISNAPIYSSNDDTHISQDNSMSPRELHNDSARGPDYNTEYGLFTSTDGSFFNEPSHRDVSKEMKIIVFESCLDNILCFLPCRFPQCSATIISRKKRVHGSNLMVTGECLEGHKSLLWSSQPSIGKMSQARDM